MKTIIYLIILVIASAASFYAGNIYNILEAANRAEDIIADEFQITERHANIPSCQDIASFTEKITVVQNGDDYILWSYDAQQQLVIKAIVTADMNTIYLETSVECP